MDALCPSCKAEYDQLSAEVAWDNYLLATLPPAAAQAYALDARERRAS